MTSISIAAHSASIEAHAGGISVDLDFTFDYECLAILDEFSAKEVTEYFGSKPLLEQMDDNEIVNYLEDCGYEIIKH